MSEIEEVVGRHTTPTSDPTRDAQVPKRLLVRLVLDHSISSRRQLFSREEVEAMSDDCFILHAWAYGCRHETRDYASSAFIGRMPRPNILSRQVNNDLLVVKIIFGGRCAICHWRLI